LLNTLKDALLHIIETFIFFSSKIDFILPENEYDCESDDYCMR
jgi:hypothetical protein